MKARAFVVWALLVSLAWLSILGVVAQGRSLISRTGTSGITAGSTIERVSVTSNGAQGDGFSQRPFISADGRYVAFESSASNLVEGDTNGCVDIFVHDRQTGQTSRVSVASGGTQANQGSRMPCLSADGRLVAFGSQASNLVAGDINGLEDIFVHDRQTGQITRVSVSSNGTEANGLSSWPAISADGRFVAFNSSASNLVPGDTNNVGDIFVHDRQTGQTTRVSVASDGTEGNDRSAYLVTISADGRDVAFQSGASNLVDDDTNGIWDSFVHDRQTGQTVRVSVASGGTQQNGTSSAGTFIAADGRFVAFHSNATNLVGGDTNNTWDVFVHDRQTSQTSRVSVASDGTQGWETSSRAALSADGRYAAFDSEAKNLVANDSNGWSDIFVRDRQAGQTTRVSVAADGAQGNEASDSTSLSADGRFVAFCSSASNLVSGDTNDRPDVFVHDREQGEVTTVATIPPSGGSLTSWFYQTTVVFPQDTFTPTVEVTYTGYVPARRPLPSGMAGIHHFFDLAGDYVASGEPAEPAPGQTYSVTVHYSEPGAAIEDTLALYFWDGTQWVKEPSSMVDPINNLVSATPGHFSSWAVLGETHPIYLPLVVRSY